MKSSLFRASSRNRHSGFTLIELLMVLLIILALAAMVVPIIDNIRRTSDKASASGVMRQLMENISMYRIQKGEYPADFDSLLDSSGSVPSFIAKTSGGVNQKGIASALSSLEAQSLTEIGIRTVQDHETDLSAAGVYRGRPGNSGILLRDLAAGEEVFILTNPDIVASVYPKEVAGDSGSFDPATGKITKANGVEVRLVAFGVGPRCGAVGQTMQSAPAYSGVTQPESVYNRYLVIFAVYDGAINGKKRAQLKGAMDSTFDFLNQEVIETEENTIE